jgi:hypothetical protein
MSAPLDFSADPSPQVILIHDFSQDAQLGEIAQLLNAPVDSLRYDAGAALDISASIFRSVFQFSIDNIVGLTDPNTNITDLRFYVVQPNQLPVEIATAPCEVLEGPISTVDARDGSTLGANQQSIPQDYLRYLAKSIFGTAQGVDLFYNETALVADICYNVQDAWHSNLKLLLSISTDSTPFTASDIQGTDGAFYYDNSGSHMQPNIGKVIFDQLLTNQPGRFIAINDDHHIDDVGTMQSIPLIPGDSIRFTVTVKAHATQKSLGNGSSIADRTYLIVLNLV